jgi:hypothetical protein
MIIKLYLITLTLFLTSCFAGKDLSKTLRFADDKSISVSQIKLQELQKMKKGKSCSYSFILIPMFGSSSVIDAADNGKINQVQLIGETGFWVFPFLRNCTIVYGDSPNLNEVVIK